MTATAAQATQGSTKELYKLKRVPGNPGSNDQVILVGSNSAGTTTLVIWFPVIAAVCYGAILPFTWTPWGENNLELVMAVWGVLWLALTAITLSSGAGHHFYALDIGQRTITHLNTSQSTPLILELHEQEGLTSLVLKEPLDSGWHLEASARSVSEIAPDDLSHIPEWRILGLVDYVQKKARDGSLVVLFAFVNIPLLAFYLASGVFGLFLLLQVYLFAAWLVAQAVSWLVERRDHRLFREQKTLTL
ncbi:hypothetical protein [Marinobacter zhejiangensis]|uniref:Uncharacterized protein n=1 Tax=Marinobacter zhejiangensis TaxID=488535 RepID=A0A1I4LAU6_9GAMM|nr:hypothetical protein [Marinobacter zhejiangensis]SFL87913.1 hypothetical protein SAMN04487963_0371 [Marinobacter zhejiangensis]